MTPSVKTIETRLGLDRKTALTVRKLMDRRLDPESFASVQKWVSKCYNRPSRIELIMEALNEVLGGYGVEALRVKEHVDNYHFDIGYTYVNMGDTYKTTILRDNIKGRFIVCDYGTIVESDMDNFI